MRLVQILESRSCRRLLAVQLVHRLSNCLDVDLAQVVAGLGRVLSH